MPPRELVKLHDAAGRLASKWGIPSSVTEQIVKAVLQGGKCFVRGRRPGEMMGLRDISKEIGATLSRYPCSPSGGDFWDVEIDWNDLRTLGRELVPSEWEYWVSAAEDAEAGPYRTLKSDDERKAADLLAGRLRTDPNMKVSDALDICQRQFRLSARAIRQRVWPLARVAANLEPTAPPGPKPKMNRRPKQNRRA